MIAPRFEDVAFHGCAALAVASLVVLYALRYEGRLRRWLDRKIDAALDIPTEGVG